MRLLLRYGGAVILHDGRMLDLYAIYVNFEKTAAMAAKELGRPLRPNEMWAWLAGDIPTEGAHPGRGGGRRRTADDALATGHLRRRTTLWHRRDPPSLLAAAHDRCSATDACARQAARRRLHVADDEVLIVSIGYVHPTKAPTDCLWALVLLRSWGVNASLHFVGASLMKLDAMEQLIMEQGLGGHVRMPSAFVGEQTYRDYLIGADVAIQLRQGTAGSVSGTLSDCIAAGLRTVASAGLAGAIDAPAFVQTVSNSPSPVLVAEAVMTVLDRDDTTAERQDYVARHGFDAYTQHLCRALSLP